MATTTAQQRVPSLGGAGSTSEDRAPADWRDPRYQAFALMRVAFTVAPIAFGLDKFFNVMVDWPVYLAPWINDIAPGSGQDFMYLVGATEILGGIIVALKPLLRRLRRRGLAGRHHRQPAHPLRLLRHRPARLRTHARGTHPRTAGIRLRPAAAAARPLSPDRSGCRLTSTRSRRRSAKVARP
jgi:hypothetical protein